jgi:hypothetical protein
LWWWKCTLYDGRSFSAKNLMSSTHKHKKIILTFS